MSAIEHVDHAALRAVAPGADPHDAAARAAWSAVAEPGDRVAGALIARLGAAEALEVALAHTARAVDGLEPAELAAGRRRWRPRAVDAAHPLAAARRAGARLVLPGDDLWPTRLDDLGPHAPYCLWVVGDAAPLAEPADWHVAELELAL